MNPLVKKYSNEKRWLNWKLETRKNKTTKVPYSINGLLGSSTNPDTWATYSTAKASNNNVGIVLTSDKRLICLDIDHVIKDGKIEPRFKEKIDKLILESNSYCELSQSLTGLHIFLEITDSLDLVANRSEPFEIYTSGRYIAVTENCYGEPKEVRTINSDEAIKILSIIGYPWKKEIFKTVLSEKEPVSLNDEIVLKKMFSSKNGQAINALYNGNLRDHKNNASSADMAFLLHLAFWTRKDATQMERIWVASPLGDRKKTKDRTDYRLRSITAAIKGCNTVYTPSNKSNEKDKNEGKESQIDILLKIINNKENTVLFHDEVGDNYISLETKGHNEIWNCKSKSVKRWLANEYWELMQSGPSSEAIKNTIAVLEGRASFAGPLHKIHNRFAWNNNDLWYDLTNEAWQAIKINSQGWEIIDNPPILFKRYSHNRPQIIPAINGDAQLILNYVNIQDKQQQLLLMVFLISCFIPDIAHVVLVIFGSQGSAKSTLSKLLRRIIDPSVIEVSSIPDTHKELVQTLAHHAFLFFDNVSYISETTSDILCKAVTGSGFPKRELYSDDEDVIYSFKRCIGINGINLMGTRPDLLERSLLLELHRIDPNNRKQEKELMIGFEKEIPLILGGVLDVLVKAIQIKSSVQIKSLPRMADFAVWGCAISRALGYTESDFLDAYHVNISKQTETVLNENIVATAIMSFMDERNSWTGTATGLLGELTNHAKFQNIDTYEKYWPKASNTLARRLNELKVNLKEVGIHYMSIPGNTREIILKKIATDDADDESEGLTK